MGIDVISADPGNMSVSISHVSPAKSLNAVFHQFCILSILQFVSDCNVDKSSRTNYVGRSRPR